MLPNKLERHLTSSKSKMPYTIVEELIVPAAIELVSTMKRKLLNI